jgi:release factor H-coupled RctB family protein
MPDLHKGDRFPIGCAIVASGIYPALIGSDIGCGISLYPLGTIPSHLTPEKLASKLRDLDGPWEGDVKAWLTLYGIEKETEFDASSLGTVGGGNHFAEVVTVERIVDNDACESMGISEKDLYLLGKFVSVVSVVHFMMNPGSPHRLQRPRVLNPAELYKVRRESILPS